MRLTRWLCRAPGTTFPDIIVEALTQWGARDLATPWFPDWAILTVEPIEEEEDGRVVA